MALTAAMQSDARLEYLDEASRTLVLSSPVVSAFLQRKKRSMPRANEKINHLAADNPETCVGCGTSLSPPWSYEPLKNGSAPRTRQDRLQGKAILRKVRCLTCGTESTIKAQQRPKPSKVEKPQSGSRGKECRMPVRTNLPPPTPSVAPMMETTVSSPSVPAPAPRRKVRGKNATLQALLANKKAEPAKTTGFGLDFKDLMKG